MENRVYYTQAKTWEKKNPSISCPQQLELGSHYLGLCSVKRNGRRALHFHLSRSFHLLPLVFNTSFIKD